jgi:hypothetical protein
MREPAASIALIFFGSFFLWGFGYQTVWSRLMLALSGEIIASTDSPAGRGPRYSTIYELRSDDGRTIRYVAGATDASIERSLPAGVYLLKKRWQLGYQIDRSRVAFPVRFYAVALLFGATVFLTGVVRLFSSLLTRPSP